MPSPGSTACAGPLNRHYARRMRIRGVDPRDIGWEQDHARYRVYFWDVAASVSDEYEVLDEVDVEEVLAWAAAHAAEQGLTHTVYVVVTGRDGPGLIRLAGVQAPF